MEAAIEAVVTRTCYQGVDYARPHIPAQLAKLLQTKQANRDKDKADSESNKGRGGTERSFLLRDLLKQ